MLIRRPGYGYALQTMHLLWQGPMVRPFVEEVMARKRIPTEADVTKVYQNLGQPGVDARATAYAEWVQDRIRALRARELESMEGERGQLVAR